ncbi:maleylpyruvate isomerase family mycothiol-dependent enzyme [Thermomonospora amylolytica]|uniref:maleylpyruvate isomerase family mycothiol-dependent enzyme n=1 Tax=Thermomonospora amylolytica TaxID=1411117 RepID=UPI000E6B6171|nr:maleylpyruvate isomerase family mycothiol-dependent enzyme [Thermomonospora amylolytica]
MDVAPLKDLDPFGIFDAEAARLEAYFDGLSGQEWDRPSRCVGWSVRDVLAHLAGEELYNHACLDDDLPGLFALLEREGVGGLAAFNEWCVSTRRDRPVAEVLDEWRTQNADTRRRMRERGADAALPTMAGPYPVGLQTFHYCSEYATHADDVGAPVTDDEAPERTDWRCRVGLFALSETDTPVQVEAAGDRYLVRLGEQRAELSPAEFVDATTARLPDDHPLPSPLRTALRCLA